MVCNYIEGKMARNKYYSTREIADMLDINESTVRRWVDSDKENRLKSDMRNGKYVVKEEDLKDFIESEKPKYLNPLMGALVGSFPFANHTVGGMVGGAMGLAFAPLLGPIGILGAVGLIASSSKQKGYVNKLTVVQEQLISQLAVIKNYVSIINQKILYLGKDDIDEERIKKVGKAEEELILTYGATFFQGLPIQVINLSNREETIAAYQSIIEIYMEKCDALEKIIGSIARNKDIGEEEFEKLQTIDDKEKSFWKATFKGELYTE